MKLRSLPSIRQDVKKISFFGIGLSNLAILGEMSDNVEIVLRSDAELDRNVQKSDSRIKKIYDGVHSCDEIDEDVIVFSPSVRRDRPKLIEAKKKGTFFTSDAELFFSSVKAPVFAITGSDGKSTSSTLTALLLSRSIKSVGLCGNIGTPMLLCPRSDAYVTELSSFQLTYSSPRVRRAAITNITPNHLNWHSSYEEYRDAKLSLISLSDEYVLSPDDAESEKILRKKGSFGTFSTDLPFKKLKETYDFSVAYTLEGGNICKNGDIYFPLASVRRKEKYNVKNLLLSLALCDGSVEKNDAVSVARDFGGLAHRCETVASFSGIDFINSSIDTSPIRTASTLASLDKKCVIILGGRKKGLSFEPLVPMLTERARAAVVMGECKDELAALLAGKIKCVTASNMVEAVSLAISLAKHNDAVLLSPAATSYDAYSSFEERGDDFKKQVFKYQNAYKCK